MCVHVKVGVPTEIKPDEYRVAMTPAGVRDLTDVGHEVLVQAGAGLGSAITDADYVAQGAEIVADAQAVFDSAELILGVKEPQAEEVVRVDALLGRQHPAAPRSRGRGDRPGHAQDRHLHRSSSRARSASQNSMRSRARPRSRPVSSSMRRIR